MNAYRLGLLKRGTVAFIKEDPTALLFSRPAITPDGLGGYLQGDEDATFTETVRLIPQSDKVPVADKTEGQLTVVEYILLAESSTKVKVHDEFTFKGIGFKVLHKHLAPEYEAKFDIVKTKGGEPVS